MRCWTGIPRLESTTIRLRSAHHAPLRRPLAAPAGSGRGGGAGGAGARSRGRSRGGGGRGRRGRGVVRAAARGGVLGRPGLLAGRDVGDGGGDGRLGGANPGGECGIDGGGAGGLGQARRGARPDGGDVLVELGGGCGAGLVGVVALALGGRERPLRLLDGIRRRGVVRGLVRGLVRDDVGSVRRVPAPEQGEHVGGRWRRPAAPAPARAPRRCAADARRARSPPRGRPRRGPRWRRRRRRRSACRPRPRRAG